MITKFTFNHTENRLYVGSLVILHHKIFRILIIEFISKFDHKFYKSLDEEYEEEPPEGLVNPDPRI